MIKYNPRNWFKLIFALHKSDTMLILWKELIYIGVFSIGLAYVVMEYMSHITVLKDLVAVYSLVGFVISLLLVFRTNTAYDRWWEGRKKWGGLVNDSRNFAIKLSMLLTRREDKEFFARMISNFMFATKEHLREGVDFDEFDLTPEELKRMSAKDHVPNAMVQDMYKRVHGLKTAGEITEEEFIILDGNLNAFLDHLGSCERIRNTPIPYSYMLFLKKFIFIYVSTLPLAFVSTFGYYSAIISTFIFYILVSMELLAEEIEDPFGTDDNDLPTEGLCFKMKGDVEEILLN
ncbi:MAG: bestrophin family ion channel [Crocinitomicaceae bacterium]|nr:bestrophin family ion channel [Crocinitomicaceae bacterium]